MDTPVKKVPLHLQSSQNRILIKNGTVVNEDATFKADVYIEDRFAVVILSQCQFYWSLMLKTIEVLWSPIQYLFSSAWFRLPIQPEDSYLKRKY